jgi:hypothetical protein
MGALVERHGGIVHVLEQNVRQQSRAEREALAELRAGDVTRAVEFYLGQDRVTTERSRGKALVKVVDQWAKDVLDGRDAAMFAWRRPNVAELNRLAREQMVAEGRVGGPELVAPGGTHFAVGDRIVTLAPLAHGQIVTSERGVVIAVGQDEDHLVVRLQDGRQHRLERDDIGAAHMAHGYATTVHRSQGVTHDLAHVYEDGGGRELAYVAMSRARDETHVYLCADDLDQAREDLCRSWATERRWKWALDTGTPEVADRESQPMAPASLEREALKQEQAGLDAALPRYLPDEIRAARDQCRDAEAQLSRLRSNNGIDWGGAISQAADELFAAHRAYLDHRLHAHSFISRKQDRLAKSADLERIAEAEQKLDKLRQPEEPPLLEACEGAEKKLADLLREATDGERWRAEHPEVMNRQSEIGSQIYNLHAAIDSERGTVDKELNPRPEPERSRERSPSYEHSSSIDHDRDYGFGM